VNFAGTNQIHVKLKNHYSDIIFLQSLGQRNKILVEGIISKFHGIFNVVNKVYKNFPAMEGLMGSAANEHKHFRTNFKQREAEK